MSNSLSVGAAVVLGGIFVGSVVAYTVSKRKKPNLCTCVMSGTSALAKRISRVATQARQGFSEGFSGAYRDIVEVDASTA